MTLLEAVLQLAVAAAGIFLIVGFWIAVQGFVRKRSGGRPDHDVLDFMAHGCGSCVRGETCTNRMRSAGLNSGKEHGRHESE